MSTPHGHFSKLKCPPAVDTPIPENDTHGCVVKKKNKKISKKHLTKFNSYAIIKVQRGGGENGRLTLKKSPVARHKKVTYYKKNTTHFVKKKIKKVLDKLKYL